MSLFRIPALSIGTLAALILPAGAWAADPTECATVRMSDPGWTDITSTNGVAGTILQALGYEQNVQTLAVPVTFESLKNGDLDVFLGNWMPAQTRFIEPLTAEGAIEVVDPNLDGVKFTLAVPDYVAAAGVDDFADLAAHGDEFEHTIYGIEPGAPANQNIQKMIDAGDFGLSGWKLVESSEQAMLSQVERAVRQQGWIVFLAWEPHPMNTAFTLDYLAGGDAYFGPDYGGATIYTVTRAGYADACPNLHRLFSQLRFSVDMENEIMASILDDGMEGTEAAGAWLKRNPDVVTPWLEGVTTLEGGDGLAAVQAALAAP